MTAFRGAAKPIDDVDLPRIAAQIAVGEDELHAFMDTESLGSGFYSDGSLKRLFEPHVFYRQLSGQARDEAVRRGLAYPNWGMKPYPRDSTQRILAAAEIDEEAAYRSTSWGSMQVLGLNYKMCGFDSAKQMVEAMMDDEEVHLAAAVNFIVSAGIDDDLRALAGLTRATRPEDCIAIVRVYNGPGYAKNKYHEKFAQAHNRWRSIRDTAWDGDLTAGEPSPMLPRPLKPKVDYMAADVLKPAQQRLLALGYTEVGMPDGKWGTKTRSAVMSFRMDHDLPLVPEIDDEFLAALMLAKPRAVAVERAEATLEDLREGGSRIVQATDGAQGGAVALGGVGTVGVAVSGLDLLSERLDVAHGLLARIEPLKDTLVALGPVVMVGLAVFIGWQVWKARKARLDDHRSGKTAAPNNHAAIKVQR